MKITRKTTALLILATVAVWVAYDVAAFATVGGDVTLSTVISSAAAHRVIVGFAAGLLCGHWFWPSDAPAQRISEVSPKA